MKSIAVKDNNFRGGGGVLILSFFSKRFHENAVSDFCGSR